MRLLFRIVLRISLVLTIVLGIWAVLFYYAMIDEINDEVDDSLENYSEMIIVRSLAGDELPSHNSGSNNQYYLNEVDDGYATRRNEIEYKDSMVYIAEKKETEPARILTTIFKNEEGKWYKLTVSTPTIEKADLKEAILYWTIFLYATLLLIIISVVSWVSYRSMKPLYTLLNWLDSYRTGQKNKPLENSTNITEFKRLNKAALKNAERNEQLYEQQKQFIGNASHEIQTPLAICRNRLELLLEDESLSEQQLDELLKIYQTLEHITKLNKSLLLLSKIDNNQFADNKQIVLNLIVKQYLEDFREVYASRNYSITLEETGEMVCTLNHSLAAALLSNLLKNAFVHNIENGVIQLKITSNSLVVCNSSNGKALDETRIFERFYQGEKREGSTGLGLAIASSICKQENLYIHYRFEGSLHCFEIMKEEKGQRR